LHEKLFLDGFVLEEPPPSGAKAPLILARLMYGLKPVPFKKAPD
jgi:hypothetical protein